MDYRYGACVNFYKIQKAPKPGYLIRAVYFTYSPPLTKRSSR